jgi:hypothetical protein
MLLSERAAGGKPLLAGSVFMTKEEINVYQKSLHFQRNEAIFILHHVDLTPVEDLVKTWNLSVEEIEKIIALHTEYWEATETTA